MTKKREMNIAVKNKRRDNLGLQKQRRLDTY